MGPFYIISMGWIPRPAVSNGRIESALAQNRKSTVSFVTFIYKLNC